MNKVRYSIIAILFIFAFQLEFVYAQDDGCPQKITLEQQNHTFSSEISAEREIESSKSTINPDVNTVFKAGDLITLKDGFVAKENSNFRAFNGDASCNNVSFSSGNGICETLDFTFDNPHAGVFNLRFEPLSKHRPTSNQSPPTQYVVAKIVGQDFVPVVREIKWESVVFVSVPNNIKSEYVVYVNVNNCTPPNSGGPVDPNPGTTPGTCVNEVKNFTLETTEEWRTLESNIPIQAGSNYQLTVEAKLTNGGTAEVGVKSNLEATGWFKKFVTINNSTNFTPMTINFKAEAPLDKLDLYVRKISPNSSLNISNVCLAKEGSNPNPGGGGPNPGGGSFSVLKDYPTPEQNPTCGMYIGAAGTSKYLPEEEEAYQKAFDDHFNLIVPEIAMKMDKIKENGEFAFNPFGIDTELRGLKNLPVRGHTLCWHGGKDTRREGPPQCFNNGKDDNEEGFDCGGPCIPCRLSHNPHYLTQDDSKLESRLVNYITEVITKSKNQLGLNIESWDVVNEAFRGTDPDFHKTPGKSTRSPFRTADTHNDAADTDPNANGIACIWEKINYNSNETPIKFTAGGVQHTIPKYIKLAFETADAVQKSLNLNAPLIYNDWGAEFDDVFGNKSDYQFEMIKALANANVPIHGVGFQCHFELDTSEPQALITSEKIQEFEENIKRYRDIVVKDENGNPANLKIYLTEIDIELPANQKNSHRQKQYQMYKELAEMAVRLPEVKAFIVWGTKDKYSWKTEDHNNCPFPGAGEPGKIDDCENEEPLLFDDNFNPKLGINGTYQGVLDALNNTNNSCSQAKLSAIIDGVTNIFTAYPNPFDQTLQIEFEEEKGDMTIYDMTGRTMMMQKINGEQTTINTEDLQPGYYLIEVKSNDKIERQKIIKH